ncbi:MAG: serine protease [Acidobacteria bacterium]|nr:serine protease [Acidobacteriota bacterium]
MESAAPTSAIAHDKSADYPSRVLVQELIRGVNPLAKTTVLSVLILLLSGIIILGLAAYKEFSQNRRLNDEQNRHLAKLEEQITRTNQQVAELTQSSQAINAGLSLPTKLWSAYSGGVCLISGTYVFIDPDSGRPLRLPKRKDGSLLRSEEQTQLTPEGDGEIAEVDYEGTGFYVGDGYILTNQHIVVEPWKHDLWLKILENFVNGKPRLIRLQAFFPGQSRSYPLKFKLASSQDDLAVCTLNLKEVRKEIPILPLDQSADVLIVGQAVTMMGYPSGADRLIALLPEKEAQRLRERYGESGLALIGQLAQRDLVKPLTSQGHIMDLHPNQIIYDGITGEGESGAPIFGPSGRVIGIHFGYFSQNRISNMAVPISRGLALLQRAGWRPVE